MFHFEITRQSKKSRARLGVLRTVHGDIATPAFVPVATQAVVKTLTSEEAQLTGSAILIANTFHLHLRPGEKTVKAHGGLHSFMNWSRPLMTDSGGFQVFSLGFGRDIGSGKIGKGSPTTVVSPGAQPRHLRITPEGVFFRSPLDGQSIFLGPAESLKIQHQLGGDIIFAFDECTPPAADHAYTRLSLKRTHAWAEASLTAQRSLKNKAALYGVIQGGKFADLREESAAFIGRLPFAGFGIGGEFGDNSRLMKKIIRLTISFLLPEKPRHLLGIGHLKDIPEIIREGVDTFDCIVPTHYARHGTVFIRSGRLDLSKKNFLRDRRPLDPDCTCFVCHHYRRGYLAHLLRAQEITALRLLTFHNLHFFNNYVASIRRAIAAGSF